MTTDNAKPAVITAAQFVADGYAAKVAAGECVVRDDSKCIVLRVDPEEDGHDDHVLISYTDGLMVYSWAYERDTKFTVHWLPATPATADEVTRLRAENARLREALANARFDASFIKEYGGAVEWSSCKLSLQRMYDRLTAALNATQEAS